MVTNEMMLFAPGLGDPDQENLVHINFKHNKGIRGHTGGLVHMVHPLMTEKLHVEEEDDAEDFTLYSEQYDHPRGGLAF